MKRRKVSKRILEALIFSDAFRDFGNIKELSKQHTDIEVEDKSPAIICNKIMERLDSFRGEEEQYDDITMIVFCRKA